MLRFKRLLIRLLLPVAAVMALTVCASRTVAPPLPAGVTQTQATESFDSQNVSALFFKPKLDANAPLVVVAHGFTRSQRYMAGWGSHLADQGFLVIVPTQPKLADHEANGRVIAGLVEKHRGQRKVGLVGFSMGGLTTLLATTHCTIDAWVGLDPVDMAGKGKQAAARLAVPAIVLRAEPGPWNRQGNAKDICAALSPPKFMMMVKGASHVDAEWPTDWAGQLACGTVKPERQEAFRRYATAFLRRQLLRDRAAADVLSRASSDPDVRILDQ